MSVPTQAQYLAWAWEHLRAAVKLDEDTPTCLAIAADDLRSAGLPMLARAVEEVSAHLGKWEQRRTLGALGILIARVHSYMEAQ